MTPVELNLPDLYMGDTYSFIIEDFYDDDAKEPFDLVANISEIRTAFRVRNENGPETMLITLSGGGFSIYGDNNDNLLGTLTSEETKEFIPGKYVFDIEFTYQDGSIQTWFDGEIIAKQEVTR